MGNQDTESNMCEPTFDKLSGEAIICSYSSWLAKHPSALENFEEIMSKAKGKMVVVFLDYDGTLSQIVHEPELAFMTKAMRDAVSDIADCFPTAIVSGRKRDKVFNFVQLKEVYYAGSHGMDISTQSGSWKYVDHKDQIMTVDEKGDEICLFTPAQEHQPKIREIEKALQDLVIDIKGSMVEDNKFCVSVHYRKVTNEKDVDILKKRVEILMKDYPEFKISSGKMVIEIRPDIEWDKGLALQYLLETFGFDSSDENVFPMYIGDDKTDEDAFETIRKIGRGFSIVVSSTPKDTSAEHSLKDPTEVMAFLIQLVKWKNSWSPTNEVVA